MKWHISLKLDLDQSYQYILQWLLSIFKKQFFRLKFFPALCFIFTSYHPFLGFSCPTVSCFSLIPFLILPPPPLIILTYSNLVLFLSLPLWMVCTACVVKLPQGHLVVLVFIFVKTLPFHSFFFFLPCY